MSSFDWRQRAAEQSAVIRTPWERAASADSSPSMDTAHRALERDGEPTLGEVRDFSESRIGHDFSRVRVHADGSAAEAAGAPGERAYTVGPAVAAAIAPERPLDVDGSEEPALEKQRPAQRRRPRAGVNVAPPERVEAFFQQNSQVMQSLNPHRSAVNCPATAAAVDEYLGTGAVNPAPSGGPRSVFAFAQQWTPVSDLASLLRQPGSYASVRGTRSQEYADLQGVTREHYFVVVNRGGQLWALDAYNRRQLPLDELMAGDQFQTLEYFRGPLRVTHIPNPPPGVGRP